MADIIRASLFGTMPGGEVWSVNPIFKITSGAVITYTECVAAVAAINALTIPTTLLSANVTAVQYTGARVEARTFAGVLEAQAEGLRGTPATGSSSVAHPFQTSMVISLRTLKAGASGRGRLYWPATGMNLANSNLRVTSGNVGAFLADAKTYLTAVQNAIDGAVDESIALAVWSRKEGSAALVTRLMAGDIMDTQRRRRDNIPETYQEVAYV